MENRINSAISKIHNHIYANEGLNNFEVLDVLLKVLYCKSYDELNNNMLEKASSEYELHQTALGLLENLKSAYPNMFTASDSFNIKEQSIIYIFNELSHFKMTKLGTDLKGHIIQRIIDRSFREGRGQFFTPSAIVDFIVKMVDPKKDEVGCDPACGTGGFVFSALEHIAKNDAITASDINNVFFYDISRSIAKLIAMRLMFEFGIQEPNLYIQDTLSSQIGLKFDYILSNPPFGSQGRITDSTILSKYFLGKDEKGKLFSSQVPDILFIEKIINMLKDGGRAAIVLPDGNFENPSSDYIRKYIFNSCKINAIISLPDGSFIPYGTGVKASILFVTKDATAKENPYNVFFGKINKLGYSFSKHSKPVYKENGDVDEDYSAVLSKYKNEKYDDFNFLVSSSDIACNNYNLSYNKYCLAWKNIVDDIQKGAFSRIAQVCSVVARKEKISADETYKYVEIGNVSTENCEIVSCSVLKGSELPSRASYRLKENDIIVAIAGNAIGTEYGAKAIVSKEYDGAICTNGFIVLRNATVSPFLLLNFFNSKEFQAQVIQSKYGTAIPTIAKEDFMNISFPRYSGGGEEHIISTYTTAFKLKEQAKQLLKSLTEEGIE